MLSRLHHIVLLLALTASSVFAQCPETSRYFLLQCDAKECVRGAHVERSYAGPQCEPSSKLSDLTDEEIKAFSFPISAAAPNHGIGVYSIDTQERCIKDLLANLRNYPLGNALMWSTVIPDPSRPRPEACSEVTLMDTEDSKDNNKDAPVVPPPFYGCRFSVQELVQDGGAWEYYLEYLYLKFG